MGNVSIGVRLIGGFAAVAVITLIVGVIGWMGVASLDRHIEEIGEVRLPSIASLLALEREGKIIRGAEVLLVSTIMPGAQGSFDRFDQLLEEAARAEEMPKPSP